MAQTRAVRRVSREMEAGATHRNNATATQNRECQAGQRRSQRGQGSESGSDRSTAAMRPEGRRKRCRRDEKDTVAAWTLTIGHHSVCNMRMRKASAKNRTAKRKSLRSQPISEPKGVAP